METREKELTGELMRCFSDWEGAFEIDVEEEEGYNEYIFYSVEITHKFLGPDYGYCFAARVDKEKNCEIEMSEDSWTRLDTGSVFAFLWFESAKSR